MGFILVFALSLGLVYTVNELPPAQAAITPSITPHETVLFSSILASEGLAIAGYSQTQMNIEGAGDDTSFGPLALSIPTHEEITQFTMNVDGVEQKIEYGTYVPDEKNTTVFIWNHATPLSLWLTDGEHVLSFEIHTTNHVYHGGFSVHIDTTPPSFDQKGNTINVTDDMELGGATVSLFNRSGVDAPIIVQEVELKGIKGSFTIQPSNALVADGKWFRIISVSDKAGNNTIMTPDDSRTIDEVVEDYSDKRIEKVMEDTVTLTGVDSPTYGPVYIFNVDSDTTPIPGNMWDIAEKKTNLAATINDGRIILLNAGNGNGFLAPSFPTISQSVFEVKNESSFAEFGIVSVQTTFPTSGGNVVKNISGLNLADPVATSTFAQKMWAIKSADLSKTPIVMIDTINKPPRPINMQYANLGFLMISYANLSITGNPGVYNFNSAKASNVFAHEMGHALGLGHAQDPDNLQYPDSVGGSRWNATQSAVVAGHTRSDGLLPPHFGRWFTFGATTSLDSTCSNRFVDQGKKDSTDQKYFEESEDTFAGKFTQAQALTVEISDQQVNGNTLLKFCPITHKYDSQGVKHAIDPPIAVPGDTSLIEDVIDGFSANDETPDMRIAMISRDTYENVGLFGCSCYSFCELVCSLAQMPPGDIQAGYAEACANSCGGDPSYILTNEELIDSISYLGYETPTPQGQGCACPPMMGQIASSSCGVTAGVCGGTCSFVIEGPPYIYEAACVGY